MKKTLFLFCALGLGAVAADTPLQETEMKPTAISIFKNGYGFVTLQGNLGAESSIRLNSLPVPSIGTFWIQAEQGVEISSIVSGLFDYERSQQYGLMELAAANPGAEVTVLFRVSGDVTRRINGSILPFPRETFTRQGNTIGQIEEEGKNPLVGNILLIKTSSGTSAIERSSLINIDFQSDVKLPKYIDKRPCVELQLAAAAPDKKVEASCLSSGITWYPSYRLDLGDDNKGTLSAKATVTNSLMDLEHISMELITGYPSLANPSEVDPIAMKGAAQMVRAQATKSRSVMMNSAPMDVEEDGFESKSAADFGGAVASGTDTGNLFFYPVDDFTAKVGQVVTKNLFSKAIEFKHVYPWRVGDPSRFPQIESGQAPELSNIEDCIRFTNPLHMPLTAAPVEFVINGRIAGTNNIYYTPSKQECTVPMGRAINIATSKSCKITKQEVIDYPVKASSASKVTRKVTKNSCEVVLTIQNTGDKEAYMEVSQDVRGKVLEVGQGGTHQSLVRSGTTYLTLDNVIRWKLTVPAKQTQRLSFSYERID